MNLTRTFMTVRKQNGDEPSDCLQCKEAFSVIWKSLGLYEDLEQNIPRADLPLGLLNKNKMQAQKIVRAEKDKCLG